MASHDEELCAVLTSVALAGDGLVLGMGMAILAVRTWLKFRSHSKALKQIQETPISSIADLRSLVQDRDETDMGSNGSRDGLAGPVRKYGGKSDAKSIGKDVQDHKLVIVRGKVQTKAMAESQGKTKHNDALIAHNVHEKGVFVERTQTYLYNEWRGFFGWGLDWRGLMGWVSLKDHVTVSKSKVPFVLADSDARWDCTSDPSNLQIFVHVNLDEIRHPLPLVTVYHNLNPVPASSYTLLQAMFGRRYPVGLLDEEKILPIGKEITAVGLLTSAPDGHPMIQSSKNLPCFLTDGTRDQLVSELANGTKVLMWAGIAVSTVAAGILGYAFIKNWAKWQARRQERHRRDEESRQERLLVDHEAEDMADVPDGEICVVCLMRRRRAAFISCGHRVCCVSCAQRIEQGELPRCPVCRQPVTGFVRVFDS